MSDGLSRYSETANAQRRAYQHGHVWFIGVLISLVVLLAFAGDSTLLLLRYDRGAVTNGEYWRLLTGHLVHGSAWHTTLNVAGTGLIGVLFGRDYSPRQWLFIALLCMVAIDAAFVFYEPQLQWYVGLSGLLHGAIAAGVIAWWRYENRRLTYMLTTLLIVKLLWEQQHGALPFSGDMPVIVDAHLFGALGGTVAASLVWLRQRHWPPSPR